MNLLIIAAALLLSIGTAEADVTLRTRIVTGIPNPPPPQAPLINAPRVKTTVECCWDARPPLPGLLPAPYPPLPLPPTLLLRIAP